MVATPIKKVSQPESKVAKADPLEPFRQKGEAIKPKLLAYQGQPPIGSSEVAQLLEMSSEEVRRQRQHKKLIAVTLPGKRGYFFPLWQFQGKAVLPGLAEVFAALEFKDDWTPILFLCSGDRRLDGDTPLARLQAGDLEAVVTAASLYGEVNPA
jgi:hypothetical protein